jgi:hypothetical protein
MTRRRQRLRKQKLRTQQKRTPKPKATSRLTENTHHRMPRSRGGGGGDNLVLVPVHLHKAYHDLFSNSTPEELCAILNEWISPEFELVCLKRNFRK